MDKLHNPVEPGANIASLAPGVTLAMGILSRAPSVCGSCKRPFVDACARVEDTFTVLGDLAQKTMLTGGFDPASIAVAFDAIRALSDWTNAVTAEIADWMARARDDRPRVFLGVTAAAQQLGRNKGTVSRAVSSGRLRNYGSAARPLVDLTEGREFFKETGNNET